MPPAAHAPASERARRVPRSARERTANRRAGSSCRGGVAVAIGRLGGSSFSPSTPSAPRQARARSSMMEWKQLMMEWMQLMMEWKQMCAMCV